MRVLVLVVVVVHAWHSTGHTFSADWASSGDVALLGSHCFGSRIKHSGGSTAPLQYRVVELEVEVCVTVLVCVDVEVLFELVELVVD